MLQRPDAQSFTKFLASVGLFLSILAFVGPGLVLRETKVLEVKQTDLSGYTALARKELLRRQRISRDVALAAPWGGGVVLLLGAIALCWSIPRLRRQENVDDERLEWELRKLKREITPQDTDERRARIEAEVDETTAEESATSGTEVITPENGPIEPSDRPSDEEHQPVGTPNEKQASPSELPEPAERPDDQPEEPTELPEPTEGPDGSEEPKPPLAEQSHARAELMRTIADVEERVLHQIARVAPPLYAFHPQVKLGPGSQVMLDGVLVSSIDQLGDVAIEIKFIRPQTDVSRRLREAVRKLDYHRMMADLANPKGWLIAVTEGELDPSELERIAALSEESIIISVVQATRIEELQLPRDRLLS